MAARARSRARGPPKVGNRIEHYRTVALNCLIVTAVKLPAAEAAAGRWATGGISQLVRQMTHAIETDRPQTLGHGGQMANCGIALTQSRCSNTAIHKWIRRRSVTLLKYALRLSRDSGIPIEEFVGDEDSES